MGAYKSNLTKTLLGGELNPVSCVTDRDTHHYATKDWCTLRTITQTKRPEKVSFNLKRNRDHTLLLEEIKNETENFEFIKECRLSITAADTATNSKETRCSIL